MDKLEEAQAEVKEDLSAVKVVEEKFANESEKLAEENPLAKQLALALGRRITADSEVLLAKLKSKYQDFDTARLMEKLSELLDGLDEPPAPETPLKESPDPHFPPLTGSAKKGWRERMRSGDEGERLSVFADLF